jgi:hypothetical protein
MTQSNVNFRLTKTRLATYKKVWLFLPNLENDYVATIDYLATLYVDTRANSSIPQTVTGDVLQLPKDDEERLTHTDNLVSSDDEW